MQYNLIDEKWLPVLFNNGKVDRLNLIETLSQAHFIREIACSNPMDRFAIFRFLLAVLYWCKNDIAQNKEGLTNIPNEWLKRLTQEKDCFNLLGEGNRFYQFRGSNRPRTIADLMMYEIPSGNNIPHFIHTNDEESQLCLNCCTFALLRMPVFTILGGNTKPFMYAGINGALPFYNVETSNNLLSTLLNHCNITGDLGAPIWQSGAQRPLPTQEVRFLEGLTHLSRYVWLSEPQNGRCISCNKKGIIIQNCNIESPGPNENASWNDPNIAYKLEKNERKSLKTRDITSPKEFGYDRPTDNLIRHFAEKELDFENEQLTIHAPTDFKGKFCDFWVKKMDIPKNKSEQVAKFKQIALSAEFLNKVHYAKNIVKEVKTSDVESYRIPIPLTNALRPHTERTIDENVNITISKDEDGIQLNPDFYNKTLKIVSPSLFNKRSVIDMRNRYHFENFYSANVIKSMKDKNTPKPKKGKNKDESTD